MAQGSLDVWTLRRQDSNLDRTAPKAVVLPLHYGGPRGPGAGRRSQVCHSSPVDPGAASVLRGNQPAGLRDNGGMPASDEVDRIVGSWRRERPDLDFAPLQVLSRVARLSKHLDRARRTAFSRSELESWEFDVLSALRRAGAPYELSPRALLQQTLVSSGTMTNRIDRLVGRGLVTRRTDPHDGRGVLVGMTPGGLERVDTAITRLLDAEAELLSTLSPVDQERLAGLLRKLSLDFD
jgi:DNA-binding MarR family transcriptional regulator